MLGSINSPVGDTKQQQKLPDLSSSTPNSDVNPLKSDAELVLLLKKLSSIGKYKKFQGWKSAFLSRLEQFLYEEGMKPAEEACNSFDVLLKKFIKRATKVQDFIEQGQLSDTKKTVKASLALNEMCNDLTTVVQEVEQLVPSTNREEKKRGFTKFHLGAVLIRQGFHQYTTMKAIEEALEKIGAEIQTVADRQQHELFAAFTTQVQRFCDVMADLNLYEVMMKCLQFAEEPEDESEEPEPINLTIKASNGNTLRLELDPTETIGNIKEAIAEACGIDAPRQVLKFKGNEMGDDSKTLLDLEIADGSTLTVEPYKVPITVNNNVNGETIQIMVDPTNRMSEIKEQLQKESGLDPENQKLSMNGVELVDDSNTAEFYGIKAGSELDLDPRAITVSVKMPNGDKIELQVSPADTADSIKQKIEQETGLEAPRQVLKSLGKELNGDESVKEMGLKDGSPIVVDIFKIPVKVNTLDGNQIEAMIDPTETLRQIKKQLEVDAGLPADNQKLFLDGNELVDDEKTATDHGIEAGSELDLQPKTIKVNIDMPDGSQYEIQIEPFDNSSAIKTKIEKATGMKAPRQVLKMKGKELPQDKSATDMGVQDGSTIKVDVFKVPVTVSTMDGKQIKVMVDPSSKLGQIKVQLEKESGLPAGNQKLFLDGNELDDDNKTAADCGIKSGSELDLEPKSIKVSVEMPDGTHHDVDIKPSDSSDSIKAKIEKETGMIAPRQVLKFNGKELPKGKTVKDMGLKDGSPIKVEIFKVPITVNTMDGNQINALIDPTEKLGNIKLQLESDLGVPASNQKLFLNGAELADNNQSAADHGVKAGSVLDMEPASMSVTVEMPDGATHVIGVKPSDTTDDIRAAIAEETGLAAPRQVLKFRGKDLPKGKTVKDVGIRDGSTLSVEIYKVPVKINLMDGRQLKVMVDPSDKLSDLKKQLEQDSGVPAGNQQLFFNGDELNDNVKTAGDYGIKGGSELDLEPRRMKVSVEMPDGSVCTVDVKPSDSSNDIKVKIENETGLAAARQVLKHEGKDVPAGKTAREAGIREDSTLKVSIYTIPISVVTKGGKTVPLQVEPTQAIDSVKKTLAPKVGIEAKKQKLTFHEEELKDGRQTVDECGIKSGAVLSVEAHMDPIIFVDIKCGTLFAVDREEVLSKEVLTPKQGNKLDFVEAVGDSASRDKILQAMLDSPTLGVATQVVVQQTDVEDYELEEAEKVQNVWGVKLKKREKNKKGEEFIFVDAKTGAAGELSRKKYVDMKFITPMTTAKGETLAETEKDNMVYDKYIASIRSVFGVRSAN